MPEQTPHRPNYAELNKAQEEALRQQHEQGHEPTPEQPNRELLNRGVKYPDSGGRVQQETAAIEDNKRRNPPLWKHMSKDPELARQEQQKFEQKKAAGHENERPAARSYGWAGTLIEADIGPVKR